jgi:hypothetical protein
LGATVRAASVNTDAAGSLALNGGSVDTSGAQTYGERAVLGANTTLAGTFDVAGHEVHLSGSIGICVFPEDGTDRETLVRNADTAMFRAKAEGRGRSHFYTPEMTEAARRRRLVRASRCQHARRCLPPGEWSAIGTLPQEQRKQAFLAAWCRLEAGLKARGMGLFGPPAQGDPEPDVWPLVLPEGYVGAAALA